MYEYEREAAEWLHWVERATHLLDDRQLPTNLRELRRLEHDLERFKTEDLPSKAHEKQRLADHYAELHQLFERTEHLHIPTELSTQNLDRSWQRLLRSLNERFGVIEEQTRVQVFEDAKMRNFSIYFHFISCMSSMFTFLACFYCFSTLICPVYYYFISNKAVCSLITNVFFNSLID